MVVVVVVVVVVGVGVGVGVGVVTVVGSGRRSSYASLWFDVCSPDRVEDSSTVHGHH